MSRADAVNLGPPYVLKTPRLVVRCFEPADAALRKDAVDSSGEHLADLFPSTAAGPMSVEAHAAQIRYIRSAFDADEHRGHAVFNLDGTRMLGEVGLIKRGGISALELSYWLRKDATGHGVATEMCGALLKCAFELDGIGRVDLQCAPGNARSNALARRLGFTLEGRLRERQLAAHHPRGDLIVYSLLAREYPHTVAAALPLEALDFLGRPMG